MNSISLSNETPMSNACLEHLNVTGIEVDDLAATAYAWKRNGMGFTVIAGTWVDSPKKLHRETQSIFKSVKV